MICLKADCLCRRSRRGFGVFWLVFFAMVVCSSFIIVIPREYFTGRVRHTEEGASRLADFDMPPESVVLQAQSESRFSSGERMASLIYAAGLSGESTISLSLDDMRHFDRTKRMYEDVMQSAVDFGWTFYERRHFDAAYLVMVDGTRGGTAFYLPGGSSPSLVKAIKDRGALPVHIGTDGYDYWQEVVKSLPKR